MNCERLQEIRYDYLDDTLSPADKAGAERHLAGCSVCRQAVQRESLFAQTLSSQFEHAVEAVTLDAGARRAMVTAVRLRTAESQRCSPFSFWGRLVMPVAAAAAILMVATWIGHQYFANRGSHLDTRVPPGDSHREVPIQVSYSVPAYTFQREGSLVVDALTCDTRVVRGTLLVKR